MATNLTRFEVQLPLFADGTSQQTAVNQFLANVNTLCDIILSTTYVNKTNGSQVYTQLAYGLITTAQQATALGFLNTLNTALGFNVLCTINTVTSEP